jgi:putative ABC transport system permease protein
MTSRWKKIWADFWGNKSRTLLTILTIMVGTLAVGFNANLGSYMLESMDGDYLSANPSEATIFTSPFDEDLVQIAREMPGVDAAEGRTSTSAHLIPTQGESISIQFTGIEDPGDLTLNQLKPKFGEPAMPSYADKQMLMDASAESLGYKIGDTVIIELNNGRRRELILAGYIHDVAGFPYNLAQTINAYVTPETLEWLGGSRQYTVLAVSVSEKQTDAGHVTEVAQAVADRMERAGEEIYFVNVYQPGHHFAWSISQGIFFVLSVLGYMTVVLSAFLIINTITAIMTQQTRQIGIMKAVGGGNAQIFTMYVVLVSGFGLTALLIAMPLANGAARSIGGGMATYLNFNPLPFKAYPSAIIQQSVVSLLVPLLAAVWPVYNSVRVTVREAISDYGIGQRKTQGRLREQAGPVHPAPDAALVAKCFSPQATSGIDPVLAGAGRRHLHRRLQPVGLLR